MITISAGAYSPLILHARISGLAVYLDNFAIKELAKGSPARRQRFVGAIQDGAELLFSVSNAAELSGPRDGSFDAIRAFLNELGPHWFPVELDFNEVTKREIQGAEPATCCISKQFMKDYFNVLIGSYSAKGGQVVNLSEEFFRLGPVMDWLAPQRDSIRVASEALDNALLNRIKKYRAEFETDPRWLDKQFPALPFDQLRPATFTYCNLIRTLVVEARSYHLKKGDGIDFCHSLMASAFASVGTLDRHWKRRVESLPKPNKLARIYYSPEIDAMVDAIEIEVERHRR